MPKEHGTRAKYVREKCRCEKCREANRLYHHMRLARSYRMVREQKSRKNPPVRGDRVERVVLRNGKEFVSRFRRPCPGVDGLPCQAGCYLRKNSRGGLCETCRKTLAKRTVPTGDVLVHLDHLKRKYGIGLKTVADAAGVAYSTLQCIRSGEVARVLEETERRVLAVTKDAKSEGHIVSARKTWELIDDIRRRTGWSKSEVASRLGYSAPALQIRKDHVLLKTEHAIQKLHKTVLEEWQSDPGQSLRATRKLLQDLLSQEGMTKKGLAKKLGWTDLKLFAFKKSRVRTHVFEEVKKLWEYETGNHEFGDIPSTESVFVKKRERLAALAKLLPAEASVIRQAMSNYEGDAGERMLYRDLHELGAVPGGANKEQNVLWAIPRPERDVAPSRPSAPVRTRPSSSRTWPPRRRTPPSAAPLPP